ncbi:MAG: glycosylase [Planctomycetaceae bacterium]
MRIFVLFGMIVGLLRLCHPASAQDLPPAFSGFQSYAENPVFTGAAGEWDALIRERGWILKEGDRYHLWYTGYDPERSPVIMSPGYATSADGITWNRHPNNPLLREVWVEDMMVVKHNNVFYMFAEGMNDQAQLLTSADGIAWERRGTLDVRLMSGEKIPPGPYGTPTALYTNEQWYLFYERKDLGVWLATSKDMQVWTNVSDQPVLLPGPDHYDRLMIAMNQVVRHNDRWYAVLHGTGTPTKPRKWCTYFAVSDDLLTWKKCSAGPVLPIADNKSSGVLVEDGGKFRLYTMHAKVDLHLPAAE